MEIDTTKHIDYGSPMWAALRAYLQKQRDSKLGLLISADTHDKSNQIRGAIQMLDTILRLEHAAVTGR